MSSIKSTIESCITELSKANLTLRNNNEEIQNKQDKQIDEIFNEFLNVLDTFMRAEKIIYERELDKDENAKLAINRLLNAKKKLLNVFEKYDVKQIEFADGKSVDELCAVTDTEPDATRQTGDIISIERDGFTRQGHLLRRRSNYCKEPIIVNTMFLFTKNEAINNYIVVFQHKEGRYAQTYRVRDPQGKAKFLKLIFMERLEPYQYDQEGNIIEIEIAKTLKHNNLCEYVDSGTLENNGHQLAYIVTEYVRGEDLNKRLCRSGTFSLLEIKQIMTALLSAINYIHTLPRPIIHNEITIENMLLDLVGNLDNLKLIDFGAARYANLTPTSASWNNQDLHYVASERLFGDGSLQSDIFSAGVVMYKLVFGIFPWEVDLAGLTKQEQAQAVFEKRKELLKSKLQDLLNCK